MQPDPASKDAGFFSRWCSPLSTITIKINDDRRSVPQGTSVETLLTQLGLKPRFLAVELNRQVIPRTEHSRTVLADGDQVEIVTLVGGG